MSEHNLQNEEIGSDKPRTKGDSTLGIDYDTFYFIDKKVKEGVEKLEDVVRVSTQSFSAVLMVLSIVLGAIFLVNVSLAALEIFSLLLFLAGLVMLVYLVMNKNDQSKNTIPIVLSFCLIGFSVVLILVQAIFFEDSYDNRLSDFEIEIENMYDEINRLEILYLNEADHRNNLHDRLDTLMQN